MRRLAHTWFAPLVVMAAVLLTLALWWMSLDFTERLESDRREKRGAEVAAAIRLRMNIYEQVLWGGVSFMNASEEVTREEWHTYVESLRLDEQWPGIQGIGFAIPLAHEDVATHEAEIRAQGFADYAVKYDESGPDSEQRSAIVYLEPFDWRNQRAFGYDMWSSTMRRQAMRRARDDGVAATSGMITLMQETEEDVQRGFLTYVPLYDPERPTDTEEGRRAAFRGWVYAAFRAGDLMRGVQGSAAAAGHFELFDGAAVRTGSLLATSRPDTPLADGDAVVLPMRVQGRPWTLRFLSPDPLTAGERLLPWVVLGIGLLIDGLLYAALRSYATVQNRAEALASRMTRELQQQAQELRARNDELTQFAYIASHDLQEPLRTVTNFTGLLATRHAQSLDEQALRSMEFIQAATRRMSTLIHGLLEYSRIGADADRVEVDCNRLMAQVRDDLDAAISEAGATLTWDELPTVRGYETELRRLFQNLVGNAVKFRRDEVAPEVHVRAAAVADGWEFVVTDNGIGIEPANGERIFLIFQRLHLPEEYEGSGIGLAHCKKIVELHGGSIRVEPRPGGGSVFRFTLRDPDEEDA